MKKQLSFFLVVLLSISLPVAAEVLQSGENGFSVSHSKTISAVPSEVYETMTRHIDQWWDGDHSWSRNAANLYLTPEINGCFCEKLPGEGHVEHLRIIYLSPAQEIRFDGELGPLQTMAVQGRMIWKIKASDDGSEVSFTYHVHGFTEGGFSGLAPAVDDVIGEQLSRLADHQATKSD